MQDYHSELGVLRSAHQPSTVRLWVMAAIFLGLLLPFLLGSILTIDAVGALFTEPGVDASGSVSGPLICLGISTLCLVIFGIFLVSDLRKWAAARTVRLRIYQEGFTYTSQGQEEICRWDEIKDITYRNVEIKSKHSAPRKVKVIRSVFKEDGETISPSETLSLINITRLIDTARNNSRKHLGAKD